MFKGFWLENKKFLLKVGGGLLVFLIAFWGIGDSPLEILGKNKKCDVLRQEIKLLHGSLARDSHYMAEDKFVAYQEREKELAKALCLPPGEEIEGESGQLSIRFDQKITNTWDGLRQEASKAGIRLPAALNKDDFGVQQDDNRSQYQVHYSYLSIVKRAISLLVNAGVNEIGIPTLELDEEPLLVKDNDNDGDIRIECIYQLVSIPVTLSFGSLQKVLDKAQDTAGTAGPYLQVRLRDLDAKGSANEEERALQGDIEFVGFRLDEREPEKSGDRTLRSTRGDRRR